MKPYTKQDLRKLFKLYAPTAMVETGQYQSVKMLNEELFIRLLDSTGIISNQTGYKDLIFNKIETGDKVKTLQDTSAEGNYIFKKGKLYEISSKDIDTLSPKITILDERKDTVELYVEELTHINPDGLFELQRDDL